MAMKRIPSSIGRRGLSAAIALAFLALPVSHSAQADSDSDSDTTQLTLDGSGVLGSVSTNGFGTGSTNGFFANLGTNGRTCGTCHVKENAWTFTPSHAQSLASHDPLFTPNDGSDCPPTSPSQGPN